MNLLDDDQETWEIEENVGNRTLREKKKPRNINQKSSSVHELRCSI